MRTIRVAADVSYGDRLTTLPNRIRVDWYETYDEVLEAVAQPDLGGDA